MMRPRSRQLRPCLAALLAAAVAAGCVTEKPARTPGLRRAPPPAPAQLPPGPIATPVPASATTSSRLQVPVTHFKTIRYDGQILPLLSPDGRYAAVQDGETPTWPTLLAELAAEPPLNSTVAAYDLSQAPARRIDWPAAQPGLVLGRAADSRGFLVESPRPDGARWIGRVSWASGQVQWLVQGDAVNAHATITKHGHLLFTRRARLADRADLILRTEGGAEISAAPDAGTFAFPLAGDDPDLVYAMQLTPPATEIVALRILADRAGSAPPRFGSAVARGLVATGGDLLAAYQATAPVQAPRPAPPRDTDAAPASPGAPPPAHAPRPGAGDPQPVFYPIQGRMALFDARTGGFALLPHQSIAAARWDAGGVRGYLCTTPEGLVFAPEPALTARRDRAIPRDIRVAGAPYVPRTTTDPERPVILFGPAGRDPRLLEVLLMRASPVEAIP